MNIAPVSKNQVFMRDVICKYHPDFKSGEAGAMAMKHADKMNVELLFEECLAAVGGYDRVDEAGRDFNDPWNSDSKTCSVIRYDTKKYPFYRVDIGNVGTKIGSLRIAIYNQFRNRVDFAYVPSDCVGYVSRECYGKSQFLRRIYFSWNRYNDSYNTFERFRVRDFEALATAGG